jgi:hypothetical protein
MSRYACCFRCVPESLRSRPGLRGFWYSVGAWGCLAVAFGFPDSWQFAVRAAEPQESPAGPLAEGGSEEEIAEGPGGNSEKENLDKLRKNLEESLSGAVLVGQFTVTGAQSSAPAPERYELAAVRHLGGDRWLFQARIRYGEHDVTLPLTLPIRWAGDTPVITVDNFGFPGLGVYTARVMIYQDHYAGFWSGADHGGHLFGIVERPPQG